MSISRYQFLPNELRMAILDWVDPISQRAMGSTCRQFRQDVSEANLLQYRGEPSLEAAFFPSQIDSSGSLSDQNMDLSDDAQSLRASTLQQRVNELPGGAYAIAEATERGEVLLENVQAMKQIGRFFLDCQTVALFIFLNQVPEAKEFLQTFTTQFETPRKKIGPMLKWIRDHRAEIAAVKRIEVGGANQRLLNGFHPAPLIGKILNCLPPALDAFSGVTALHLQNNYLNQLPQEIIRLPLTALSLSMNRFLDIPPQIRGLSQLEVFNFSANCSALALNEACPLWSLRNLQRLNLSYNGISYIAAGIGRLSSLIHLDLSYNQLVDLPDSLASLTHLKELFLQGNSFQQLPLVLLELPSLREIFLQGNRIEAKSVEPLMRALADQARDRVKVHLDKEAWDTPSMRRLEQRIVDEGRVALFSHYLNEQVIVIIERQRG